MYQQYNSRQSQPKKGIATDFRLTPDDVKRLLEDKSVDARINVADKVSEHYNHKTLTTQEVRIAEEIFRLLAKDVELKVRTAFSEHIRDNPYIPRDVILKLARDVEQVAIPVLESSHVLSDAELIEVVESAREVTKLKAISRRPHVSDRVSTALIETNYPQVISELVGNSNAIISDKNYDNIIKDHANDSAVSHALVKRKPTIPLAVAERLVTIVSEELVEKLESDHDISLEELKDKSNRGREDATLNLIDPQADEYSVAQMVEQMITSNRLSPSIILASLCQGSRTFFEASLAQLANIPIANARKLVEDKGPHGFRALYHKTQLPDSMFDAVRLLLRANRELEASGLTPGSVAHANSLVERLLHYASEEEVENLSYIIALVRQKSQ